MFAQARPFLLALLIGLLIGVERERSTGSDPDKRPLGSRTFALLALLGALAGHLDNPAMAAVLALFAGATVLAGGRSLLLRVAPPMLAMMAAAVAAYWVEASAP